MPFLVKFARSRLMSSEHARSILANEYAHYSGPYSKLRHRNSRWAHGWPALVLTRVPYTRGLVLHEWASTCTYVISLQVYIDLVRGDKKCWRNRSTSSVTCLLCKTCLLVTAVKSSALEVPWRGEKVGIGNDCLLHGREHFSKLFFNST